MEKPESQVCLDQPPHEAMILFDNVVQIFVGVQLAAFGHLFSMLQGLEGSVSTLITRGEALRCVFNAFRKKRAAALASRLAQGRKSMVFPAKSTGGYRCFQRPAVLHPR